MTVEILDTDSAERVDVFETDDGLRLSIGRWGAPQRGSVILLHGGGQTRHAWGASAARLADAGWEALALDLRGHGDSDWSSGGDYALSRMARDVEGIARTLPGRPVIVGASMGGMTALYALGRMNTELAHALVLVDVVPRMEGSGVRRIVQFMQAHPNGFATLEEAADAVAAYRGQGRERPADLAGLRKNLRQRADGRWYWHWDPRILQPRDAQAMADYMGLFEAARAIRAPTLLVRGQRSDVVSAKGVAEFLELVPHAEFVDVAGAGHMVAGDDNDAFSAAIIDFLARHPLPGEAPRAR
ncbi:alpha/beta fold hydrolase [Candidatus Macondimonas diazotrophica]|jgi:pimeloyl-ACP methyl ester carboxylesterase|uniref:Alpha/beta hydrolase n=1 Tax=Candidatus Macondimonas diazotrophica TaxID=2305248 RepID=A0A4Z0FAC3_9GAMM|nr:alpha/beta hydrolase [Candidatus Macondimonas diazotrophica]NCU00356.1 alpha/beta hydrolase [Candidatus Macondimonas diazotrophica]TFZ82684.1 alpha/beta hydrolase [Candidatus Macondimonas diazotrophica]HBG30239.1 alpha/beta hydrolase [Gammaproteobacteria bacterium]HBG50794.1 alpha/beta hydrolase [Gammaproteobacteria bacterium]